MITLQYTLFDKQGRYKPVSTLVLVQSVQYYNEHKREIKQKALTKICVKRRWTKEDLLRFGYTTSKIRVYHDDKQEKT